MTIHRERFQGETIGDVPGGWFTEWASGDTDWSATSDITSSGTPGDVIGGGDGYSDTFTSGDHTVSSSSDLGTALSNAVSGEVVFIDSEIHTGSNTYTIGSGVTVAGDRGVNGSSGPLIQHDDSEIFDMNSDSRLTGVRLFGPWGGDGDGDFGHGIDVAGDPVEIDNCEIAAFGEASISVEDNQHCHLHHSHTHDTNKSGTGYGIDVGAGASATVERNYMENHRHCVAANGNMSGYTVRYNHIGPKQGGVMIDCHGQDGNSGGYSEVNNNIVEATEGYMHSRSPSESVQIRGIPTDAFHLWENWFYNPEEPSGCSSWCSDAIIQPEISGFDSVFFSEPPDTVRDPDENFYGSGARSSFDQIIPNHPGAWHRPWDDSSGGSTGYSVDFADDAGLEFQSSSDGRHALRWDDAGTPGAVEVLTAVYVPTIGVDSSSHVRTYLRAGGTETDPQAYFAEVVSGAVGLSKYQDGSAVSLDQTSAGLSENTWYFIRFRANGGTLRVRFWERGTAEPSTWDIDVFDDTYSSGWIGVGSFSGDPSYWDDITVGTDGQSAPIPGEVANSDTYVSSATGKLQTVATGITLTGLNDVTTSAFETSSDLDPWTIQQGDSNVSISGAQTAPPDATANSLETQIVSGSHHGCRLDYIFDEQWGYQPEQMHAKWWVYLDSDFAPNDSGKFGLAPSGLDSDSCGRGGSFCDGSDGWTARMMWQDPSNSAADFTVGYYTYHADADSFSDAIELWTSTENPTYADMGNDTVLNTGQWYEFKQYVDLGVAGANDGIMRGWIDGTKEYEREDLRFRNSDAEEFRIQKLWLNNYHGGSNTAPQNMHIYMDYVQFSETDPGW